MAGITKNGNSWIVRIYRNGKEHSTSFAFSKYGSEDAALQSARQFQSLTESQIPPTQPVRLLKNNKTGRNGVSKSFIRSSGWIGAKTPCYVATVTRNGKKIHKRFTYQQGDDRSEREAFEKACRARVEMQGGSQ